tara:strand:- start:563 stop:1357 length:795 start_codon:yes stop_codon:yes gene_type:complete
MMKKYILFLAFFGATTYSYTNSGGSPAGNSGSPASGGQTCASGYCHGGGSPSGTEFVDISFSQDSVLDGDNLTISIGVNTGGASSKVGFMASVEDENGNTFTPISVATGSKLVGDYVTHKSTGTTVNNDSIGWDFDLQEANYPDSLTVYAAVNFTNSSGNTSGDYVITAQKTFYRELVFNVAERDLAALIVGPNPAQDFLSVSSIGLTEIRLYNTMGKFLGLDAFHSNSTDHIQIDVSQLARGNYILHALFENGSIRYKHVVLN